MLGRLIQSIKNHTQHILLEELCPTSGTANSDFPNSLNHLAFLLSDGLGGLGADKTAAEMDEDVEIDGSDILFDNDNGSTGNKTAN